MKKGEWVVSAVAFLLFSSMFFQATKLHQVRRFGEMGSGFWPMFALGIGAILSALLLISGLLKDQKEKKKEEQPPVSAVAPAENRGHRIKVVLSALCLLLYIVAIPWIGFVLATPLFILAFIVSLEERRKTVLIISPILVTAVILVVFARFIAIPFPKGVGVFASFSRLFY